MSSTDLLALAFALGSSATAQRFAEPAMARAAALSVVASGWSAYRNDAGAGDVGPAHETVRSVGAVQATGDPRRDAVLLWIADHADRRIGDAARTIAAMVAANGRFETPEQGLLNAALDAVAIGADRTGGPIARALGVSAIGPDHPLAAILPVVGAIDLLSDHAGFVESHGEESELRLPGGVLRRYVPADPAGTWALNLALLVRSPRGLATLPGIVPRGVFRLDLDAEERAAMLVTCWKAAAERSIRDQQTIARRLDRGREALAGLSRNARAGEAWQLIAALGQISRPQIVRALGLSRAGGDIQARALASAGLVALEGGGLVRPAATRRIAAAPGPLNHGPLAVAAAAVDESMAEIDRLLARSVRGIE